MAILATAIGITMVYYNLFQRQVRDDLKQSAQLLIGAGVLQTDYMQSEADMNNQNLEAANLRITWIDSDGTVIYDNDNDASQLENHINRPEIQQALADGEGESVRHSDTMDMDTFYYACILEDGTILRVSTQARTITNVLLNAIPVILSIVIMILAGCILIGHLLTMQLMKPIELMAEDLDDYSIPAYKELEPFANKIRIQHENILAAAKSRQDFTANVSHELKTPITAISGYAEIIENRLFDAESEIHIAKEIKRNADRLMSLIMDIIQLSELDHQEIPRKFETIDLLEIAEECVRNLIPMADDRNVILSCEGVSTCINGDRALIREMLDNLIQNGIRYNKEKGFVYIKVCTENNHAVISVIDTGIGIPANQQERVFERFYRVDKSRSRETGGTGLGLAIVKHIVELHSAEIHLSSKPGEGTVIDVRF